MSEIVLSDERRGAVQNSLISVTQTCEILSLGRTSVYKLLSSELRSIKIGSRRLVVASSVQELIDRCSDGISESDR